MQESALPESGGTAHVLVAEDSPTQAAGLCAILGEKWDDVRVAKDGREAFEMMKQSRPRIVVSDIEMPRLTGYELSRAMKADPALRGVPILLLTELASPRAIADAIDSQADCLLMKPYDPDRLLSVIDSLVEDPNGGTGPTAAVPAPSAEEFASLRRLLHFTLEELADHHRRLIAAEEEVEIMRATVGGPEEPGLDVEVG